VKSWTVMAALGVALAGCTATKQNDTTASVAPPAAMPVAQPASLQPAPPGPWRITKTQWTKADEDGFGEFVRRIAESGCTTTTACMESAANFYHDSDPPTLHFHADCAKWAYMLRAYYASKNGLPFSYVDHIDGDVRADLRYAKTPNVALERKDIIDDGAGINTVAVLQKLHDEVWSATYRMDPASESPVEQDFYSPKIQPGSIRAGTAIYDTTGHVMLVYKVTADGSVLYMDAHPDESVSRGFYGAQIPESPMALGGGFKNFRPIELVGATRTAEGYYIGGHMVAASNQALADYSLEQYRGNAEGGGNPRLPFRYNNVPLDLYEYTRAAMSNGGFAYNPVYELEVSMGSLCRQAGERTPEADAQLKSGFASLYADLSKAAAQWEQHDLHVVYHGLSLKQNLADAYAAAEQACVLDHAGNGEEVAAVSLDQLARQSPETNVPRLISEIDDSPRFVAMQPVGN